MIAGSPARERYGCLRSAARGRVITASRQQLVGGPVGVRRGSPGATTLRPSASGRIGRRGCRRIVMHEEETEAGKG